MLVPAGSEIADEIQKDNDSVSLSRIAQKIEPYGGEVLREIIVQRRQAELLRMKEERAHLMAYKEELDIKVFEEELLASRSRKGGANPLVKRLTDTSDLDAPEVIETDFKFFSNQYPLRLVPSGKNAFFPIFYGTAASKPTPPMTCPKNHSLQSAYYSYIQCSNCKTKGIHWSCSMWCGFYCCSTCFDGDRKGKEAIRLNPARHPTFLRCHNGCNFQIQIPHASGFYRPDDTENGLSFKNNGFSITIELRVEKLPPKGQLLSLLRFSLPDVVQGRKKHNPSAYVDASGRVICASSKSSLGQVTESSMKSEAPKPNHLNTMRINTWHIITLSVNPSEGYMKSFIDGELCHVSFNLT